MYSCCVCWCLTVCPDFIRIRGEAGEPSTRPLQQQYHQRDQQQDVSKKQSYHAALKDVLAELLLENSSESVAAVDTPHNIRRREPAHRSLLRLRLQQQQQKWLESHRKMQQQQEEKPDADDASESADQHRRRRPEWQSDVFVPLPSHMLKRAGKAAEAWGSTSRPLPPGKSTSSICIRCRQE